MTVSHLFKDQNDCIFLLINYYFASNQYISYYYIINLYHGFTISNNHTQKHKSPRTSNNNSTKQEPSAITSFAFLSSLATHQGYISYPIWINMFIKSLSYKCLYISYFYNKK